MSHGLPFGTRRPDVPRGPKLELEFEGQRLPAFAGESVAVALLAAGVRVMSRSIKFHRPRSVFCLSGDCAACLMRIDGQPNQKACQTVVHEGLRCERQNAWPSASLDVLAAADEFFSDGMDHHGLLTRPRPLNQVMQKVVQQLGGLGRLPSAAPDLAALPAAHSRHVSLLVVGAGPSGLAAATAAATELGKQGKSVLLLDAAAEPGGSYLANPRFGREAATAAVAAARAAGVEIISLAAAVGFYPEDVSPASPRQTAGLVAAITQQGLLKLTADAYVYATGGHEQNLLFENNDRPGVLSGHAVGRLHTQYGLHVGSRPLVIGEGELAEALSAALQADGCTVLRGPGEGERIVRALGHGWVDGAVFASEEGLERRVACDLIALATPRAPAFELPQLHGSELRFVPDRGFTVVVDEGGRTCTPGVFACGEATGIASITAAVEHGKRVGQTAAAALL